MLFKIFGGAVQGIEASIVTVEIAKAGQKTILVGLPDSAVRESLMRVITAVKSIGFNPFIGTMINLSPADIKKEGTAYDLPIAVAKMCVAEQVGTDLLDKYLMMGELSLDGELKAGKYLQNYLDEFCYKLNRRYFGDKFFDRLVLAVAKT